MGDTDFYGRVGELESLQDATTAEQQKWQLFTAVGALEKRRLSKNSVKENRLFFTQRKHGKIRINWIVFHKLWEHFAEILNCAISSGLRRSRHLRLSRHRVAR